CPGPNALDTAPGTRYRAAADALPCAQRTQHDPSRTHHGPSSVFTFVVNDSPSKVPPSTGDSPASASTRHSSLVVQPRPSRSTPNNGAPAATGRSVTLQRAASPGSRGHRPITTPATSSPRAVATSALSAVVPTVSDPTSATRITGALSAQDASGRVPPDASNRASSPAVPSSNTSSCR